MTQPPANEQFAMVVMPHIDDAYALARWLTGNSTAAEDIVQEACLRALRGLDGYSGGNARAWLLAITRNTAFTWMARNRPKALVMTEDIEALAPADGAPTPVLIYRHNEHFISLTALPARSAPSEPVFAVDGYSVEAWRDGGTEYLAISDIRTSHGGKLAAGS